MLQKECAKCGKHTWVERHHILPKSIFGETDEVVYLCPTCHTDYHQKLGNENLKKTDMAFHFYFFSRWLYGLLSIALLILAIYLMS